MLTVQLTAVPSQNAAVVLNGQNCLLSIFTLTTGLYFSLLLNGAPVVTSRICRETALLINQGQAGQNYSGFQGDFCFVDTQGQTDPQYTGLGSRYQLVYLAPSDFA